ncbi:replication protein [Methanobrevibacter sp.]|uniref:replication protein n=1 Tax=Methanobrevibacter sp. TaxID=66852 RepID=UPI00386DBB31
MSEKNSIKRTRNFACTVYPESAPSDWIDILTEQFVPSFISPLHKDDVNPTGENKKEHYHVMIMFDNVKTSDQAREIFEKIKGVGCEIVQSVRGYARYLCHLDNPEKAQYNTDDVICLCGADYVGTIGLATDKYKALAEMQEFCDIHNVISFSLLVKYARVHRSDWYRILCDCGSIFMREYLKSKKWSDEEGIEHIIDANTGEILI